MGLVAVDPDENGALDPLVPQVRSLVRAGGDTDEAAARKAFDFIGIFEARTVRAAMDVLTALHAQQRESF